MPAIGIHLGVARFMDEPSFKSERAFEKLHRRKNVRNIDDGVAKFHRVLRFVMISLPNSNQRKIPPGRVLY